MTMESNEFCRAASEGDVQRLAEMLSLDPSLVNARDENGSPPLHEAAVNGHGEAVAFLLDHRADVNAHTRYGTALHSVASEGYADITELLISRGADINATSELLGFTALHRALWHHEYDVARVLIAHGADLNVRDEEGKTPLDHVTSLDDAEMRDLLISHGARTGAEMAGEMGETVPNEMHRAAEGGDVQKLARLLESDPSTINVQDEYGYRPLDCAAMNGHVEAVQVLLNSGAEVNAVHEHGRTALHEAASEGFAEVITALAQNGATIDATTTDEHRWTPLHVAAIQGYRDAADALRSCGADICLKDGDGSNAFQLAMVQAQVSRSEGDFEHAEKTLAVAELLAATGNDWYRWHMESALQIIARYDDTGEMYRRAPFEEYEQALSHLNNAKELLQKSGKDFEGALADIFSHMKMGYDLRSQKREARDTSSEAATTQKDEKSGPCFIATAVYGSPMAPEVRVLRGYRDIVLARKAWGRSLIWVYERVSPSLARMIAERPTARAVVRNMILKPTASLAWRVLRRLRRS